MSLILATLSTLPIADVADVLLVCIPQTERARAVALNVCRRFYIGQEVVMVNCANVLAERVWLSQLLTKEYSLAAFQFILFILYIIFPPRCGVFVAQKCAAMQGLHINLLGTTLPVLFENISIDGKLESTILLHY